MGLRDHNDQTRMSRHQLADRLRQMETTQARNTQLGSPNDRHRPMEDRRRAAQIEKYRAELHRRELMDLADNAAQATADARDTINTTAAQIEQQHGPRAAAGYRAVAEASQLAALDTSPLAASTTASRIRAAIATADARDMRQLAATAAQATGYRPPTCAECAKTGRTSYACNGLDTDRPLCAKHGAKAAATRHAAEIPPEEPEEIDPCNGQDFDPAERDEPADCQCRRTGDVDDASQCDQHGSYPRPIAQTATPDAATGDSMYRPYADDSHPDNEDRLNRAQATADARDTAEEINYQPRMTIIRPPAFEAADPFALAKHPQLSVECPKCHAAPGSRCRNYSGSNCAPHGDRTKAHVNAINKGHEEAYASSRKRAAVVEAAHAITAAELAPTPPPPIEPAPRPTPTPRPSPTPATEGTADPDNYLAEITETLVRRYGCGTALDAIWQAAHRIFHPKKA